VLLLVSLVNLGLFSALSSSTALWLRVLPVVLQAGAALLALRAAAEARVVCVSILVLMTTRLVDVPWQLAMGIALLAAFVLSRFSAPLDSVVPRRGTLPLLATFACAAVTPLALVGWVWLLAPDLSHITDAIPRAPMAVLIAFGVAFAWINAVLEEWMWRGVIQERLLRVFSLPLAVVLQALSFGSVHAHGFPSGVVGVALASIWAVMLGLLRVHSAGLLAPTLAHVVADATIAAIVISRLKTG
jgi:membrane protease YdiL (CAAX protease family)